MKAILLAYNMQDSFSYHRANPQVDIDRHVKNRIVELGQFLDGKAPIYLDMNFWIKLRNASSSGDGSDKAQKLLQLLRDAALRGIIFCPISESSFLELMKQSDKESRLRTAALIDELSLGVCLLSPETRANSELAHFIHSTLSKKSELHPLHHLIWSKIVYVLGFTHPHNAIFDDATQLVIQKSFFDKMWTIPLAELVGNTDTLPNAQELKLSDAAVKLNAGIAANADAIRSFERVLDDEIKGICDLFAEPFVDIIGEMNPDKTSISPINGAGSDEELRRMSFNLLYNMLKSNKDAQRRLPSMYVQACLHAAIRFDKQRRLKGNDLYDFQHAAAALGHCRAFFTENPLHVLIAAKNVALDKLYECHVVSDVDQAIEYIEHLG